MHAAQTAVMSLPLQAPRLHYQHRAWPSKRGRCVRELNLARRAQASCHSSSPLPSNWLRAPNRAACYYLSHPPPNMSSLRMASMVGVTSLRLVRPIPSRRRSPGPHLTIPAKPEPEIVICDRSHFLSHPISCCTSVLAHIRSIRHACLSVYSMIISGVVRNRYIC
jgi:hypothetical protein